MDNYKIINTHTNEIIKALNDLGYVWTPKKFDEQDCLLKAHWILAKEKGEIAYSSGTHIDSPLVFTELTFPELRDLVVLKRNDKADGNYNHRDGSIYYITSDNEFYLFDGRAWLKSLIETSEHLIEIEKPQPQDPALISGADVPALIKKGESVQFRSVFNVQGGGEWQDLNLERDEEEFSLGDLINTRFEWRLKPQTIKLELELPKPFEPEEDCHVYILDDGKTDGYRRYSYEVHGDKGNTFIGIWRTEDEIKQVVEQLRKIRGTNS
ncbi:hypothetical protein ABTF40_03890 [Acinetobacter baumannii]